MTPLLGLSLAWLAGVAAGLLLQVGVELLLAAATVAGVLAVAVRRRPRLWTAGLLLTIALLGGWRAEVHQATAAQDPLAEIRGAVVLRGVVAQEPDRSDSSLRWRLQVQELRAGDSAWTPASALVLVWSRHTPAVRYGDLVELEGRLEAPPQFDRFDYAAYLARQGVHAVVRYPRVTVTGSGAGEPLQTTALTVRRALSASLDRQLPEPQNALAQGILLGVRSGIPPALLEDFRRTGTTHILAISGHNMAVVAGLLSLLLGWRLSRRSWTFVVVVSALLGAYSLLVGLPPSVARAAVMAMLAFAAGAAGREAYPLGGLAFAAVAMTAFDPYLLQDAGFQLSFGAMWGLLAFGPYLRGHLMTWTARSATGWQARLAHGLAEGAAATLAATLGTLPIQAFTFGQVTLLALPATLFALPFMALLLPAAGAAAVLGALPGPLSLLAAPATALTYLLSTGMANVVQLWALAPYASLPVPSGELYWLALYLPVTVGALLLARRPQLRVTSGQPEAAHSPGLRQAVRRLVPALGLGGLAVAAVAVWAITLERAAPVSVHFLAVPGGASTLIQASDGRRVLVDGGSSGPALVRLLGEALPPWERTIDLVVLTNPKPQHLTGLLAVLPRYDVRAVAESGLPGDTPEYAEWQRVLTERSLTPTALRQGMRIDLGDTAIDVLHPTEPWLRNVRTGVDRSDTSVVLELRAHGQRVVLASDVRARSVLGMTDRGLLAESAVLQLPASSGAATLALLRNTLRPAAVVLSGSELELSRIPLERDDADTRVTVLRSDLDGTVRLTITPAGGELRGTRVRVD